IENAFIFPHLLRNEGSEDEVISLLEVRVIFDLIRVLCWAGLVFGFFKDRFNISCLHFTPPGLDIQPESCANGHASSCKNAFAFASFVSILEEKRNRIGTYNPQTAYIFSHRSFPCQQGCCEGYCW